MLSQIRDGFIFKLLKSVLFLIIIFYSNESIGQVDSLDKELLYDEEISFCGTYQTGKLNLFNVKGVCEIATFLQNVQI